MNPGQSCAPENRPRSPPSTSKLQPEPPLSPCHPDRSVAQWRDLRCALRLSQILPGKPILSPVSQCLIAALVCPTKIAHPAKFARQRTRVPHIPLPVRFRDSLVPCAFLNERHTLILLHPLAGNRGISPIFGGMWEMQRLRPPILPISHISPFVARAGQRTP